MKIRRAIWPVTVFSVICCLPSISRRCHEESRDNLVTLAVDWNEFRDLAARENRTIQERLADLRVHGATSLVLAPLTIGDLFLEHRITSAAQGLDASVIEPEPLLGFQIATELERRGVADVRWDGRRLIRTQGTFLALKDIDVGFDQELARDARQAGFKTVCRIYRDPWMQPEKARGFLAENGLSGADGVIFISDELPGGVICQPEWTLWLLRSGAMQFLLEFKPSKAALQMARVLPALTKRAHTIPVNELKDLSPEDQMARWTRAVQERMCRLLLVHASPTDSAPSFLDNLSQLSGKLRSLGYILRFPERSSTLNAGRTPPRADAVRSWLAFLLGLVAPLIGFFVWHSGDGKTNSFIVFIQISLLTVVWALVASVAADNPLTRLEIVPFHGIKLMFIFSWVCAVFLLYRIDEIREFAEGLVRRWEILALIFVTALVAYVMIRSGNAAAEWKPAWEQPVRNTLERWLIARPRFKEFLFGHPLLILGLSRFRIDPSGWLPRALIILGFVGQISIMNTFCHLHSPLAMELWRTANGLVFGLLIGWIVVKISDHLFQTK